LLSDRLSGPVVLQQPQLFKSNDLLNVLDRYSEFSLMSELSFGKLIVPALLTTGAVFTALSAPVLMFAETPLTINQGKARLYDGTVRDAALPYLMLAGATSVGLGISGVAMAGWRKSSKRAAALSEAVESQQQRRADREAHLKATLTSEAYLRQSGLDFFLEDGELTPFAPAQLPIVALRPEPIALAAPLPDDRRAVVDRRQPVFPVAAPLQSQDTVDLMAQLAWLDGEESAIAPQSPTRPALAPALSREVQPVPPPAPLTAAQGFYGFARTSESAQRPASLNVSGAVAAQDQMTIARIQSLQTQLQSLVTQIESLQANLPTTPTPMQIVEEVPLAHSGLVQQEFKLQVEGHREGAVQHMRRVAS
jgi:hypothetical protein